MSNNQWRKADVEVDEVDLQRLLNQEDINLVVDEVPNRLAFILMEAEATQLLYTEMLSYSGSVEECKSRIGEAANRQAEAYARLRDLMR